MYLRCGVMNKIVCFDFDGVICDSTEECLITGYNAWADYQGDGRFITKTEQIQDDFAEYFRVWRGLVRTADQYFVIFDSHANSHMLTSEVDFEKRCTENNQARMKYKELFFKARAKLKDQDEDRWFRLNQVYDGMKEGLNHIMALTDVFIVSGGKEKQSIEIFFKYLGINFPQEKIYDHSVASDKVVAVRKIAQLTGSALKDIIFLDDNINHLRHLQEVGCTPIMAGWGYHTHEHITIATDHNIPILALQNWVRHIIAIAT